MPSFGPKSLEQLGSCHPDLQRLFQYVVKFYDCAVIKGHRGEQEQNAAADSGHSDKRWPDGNHNAMPSNAADVYPFPIPVEGEKRYTERFYHFAGFVLGVAQMMGIKIRYGGDWDGDRNLNNQKLFDLVHFELVQP
jgi:peptidoglycan L-alanyl-D-glutamate endopeptidase CwlK